MFRLHLLDWRLGRSFLALCRRMRRSKKNVADFLLVALSVAILLNQAAKSGYSRVSSLLTIRNDHGRKGKLMQTRTTNRVIDAASVWGIEVMDPLEQWAWAQNLWSRIESRLRPLLLSYSPAAERSALRGLTAFARISHEAGIVVHHFAPGLLPVLPKVEPPGPSTLLIHHANHFVNLAEWLKIAAPPDCRVVLTAPIAEYQFISGAAKFDAVRMPEEEPDYCEHQAQKILEKFFGDAVPADSALKSLEPILIEAGIAEINLPLALLARYVRLHGEVLMEKLRASRLREFIWWPEASTDAMTVAFRGRWLAEKMAPEEVRHYPHLVALLKKTDPNLPRERYFFLNLLMALRCRGEVTTVEQLLQDYYVFHQAASLSGSQERQAWGFFHPQRLQAVFHL